MDVGVLGGHQIIEFIFSNFIKQVERIEIFQHVIVDPEISWCNSKKFCGHGIEQNMA